MIDIEYALTHYRGIDAQIAKLNARIDEQRARYAAVIDSIVPGFDDMPHAKGVTSDPTASAVAQRERIADAMRRLYAERERLWDIQNIVDCFLSRLDVVERAAVYARYVDGRTWAEVSDEICVSPRTAERLVKRATSNARAAHIADVSFA